jgi:type IV secretion system protein VirD4
VEWHTGPDPTANLAAWLLVAAVAALFVYATRRRLSSSSHGTAAWMTERELRKSLGGRRGLVLGRSLKGRRLLRNPRYTHTLLIGGTGSGKGVSTIITNLLDYSTGSCVVFDCKRDLFAATARRRRTFGRVLNLDPFGGGGARWNPLDTIPRGDPLLIDHARALGGSLIVARPHETADPHWNDKAAQVVTAVLVLVLLCDDAADRTLNSVHEIASDPDLLRAAAGRLREMGGVPARMGAQVAGLFDRDGLLTKEGSGVVSTLARHLDFLTSPAVAASVAASDVDVRQFLVPGNTLYLTIPESQLAAQQGLLRCWTSAVLRARGAGAGGEGLVLLDEASALGSLPALEEALVRGRSSGVRLLLAYQSDAQVRAAFGDKPSLIFDNCSAHVYLGAGSIDTAERVSKSLGSYTQAVTGYADNSGGSRGVTGGPNEQRNWGTSANVSVQGRPLLFPDEVLRLSDALLIAFVAGLPGPILARRIRYFADPYFRRLARPPRRGRVLAAALVVAAVAALAVAATAGGGTPWSVPETPALKHAVPAEPVGPPAVGGPDRTDAQPKGR